MLKKLTLALACSSVMVAAAGAATAHASSTQESVFQDDRALVFSGDAKRQCTLNEIRSLGANTVHVLVFWNSIAPDNNSTSRPQGFDATNPDAYPPGAWDQYDAIVSEARALGLDLIFTPTGAPTWAGRCGRPRVRNHCDPNPADYQAFVQALGRRYPSVHRWSFWNEPNQSRSLMPQEVRRHGRVVPQGAVMYRNLLRAGVAGLNASGHSGDQVLLGETAPLGKRTGSLATLSLTPAAFYQGVFCLDSRGRPLRGRAARDQGCGGRFSRLPVSGVAHHPYSRAGSRPPTSLAGSGEITMANLGLLSTLLNQGARAGRIPGRLPIYLTEFGFQTNPPDRLLGVSLNTQARWINESDWIAYRNGRVRSVAQYEMFDDASLGGFQSGLRFRNGVSKPALAAYRLPIWVMRSGSGVAVWGQVRPAGGTPQSVQIQNGFRRFRTVRTVRTNPAGYFLVRLRRQPGSNWRLVWTAPGGQRFTSRTAGIG